VTPAKLSAITAPNINMKILRSVLHPVVILAILGSFVSANELPFGLSKDMSEAAVKAKLQEKAFLRFDPEWSQKESGYQNYDVTDLELNGVPVNDISIRWYKGEISKITFATKHTDDINVAFQRLVNLRSFFAAQGKKVSSDRLSQLKKGGDLDQDSPVVTFAGEPCDIDIYTSFNKGQPNAGVTYDVNTVRNKRAKDIREAKKSSNQRSIDLLKQ
jgi:hypothetical protein